MKQQAYDTLGIKPPPEGSTEEKELGDALIAFVEKEQAKLPTKPEVAPAYNTLSTTNRMNQEAAYDSNKFLVNKLDIAKRTVEDNIYPIPPMTKYDEFIYTAEGTDSPTSLVNGKYVAYPSLEGGTDTIGAGHKIQPEEEKSGTIYGIDYTKGLTKRQVDYIYSKDKEAIMSENNISNVSPEAEYLLYDVAHRARSIKGWNFTKELKKKNPDMSKAFRHLADVSWTDKKGNIQFYNNRNEALFKNIGYTPTAEDWEAVKKAQENKRKRSKEA